MATVVLSEKYSDKIQQKWTAGSFVDGRLSNDLSFVGARTVQVYTIGTVAVGDYNRTLSANRYGTPAEIGDTVQELYMSQDKAFTGIIDKGNSLDQSIKKAGKFLSVQSEEVIVPMMDKYKLQRLADFAGTRVASSTALSASNIITRMAAARAKFLDNRVPTTGRTWFVTTDVYNLLIQTDYFKNLAKLGESGIIKGQVGEIFGAPVIECPADIMPASCNFILVHKDAACTPKKIAETKLHTDPVGVSGNLVEGRYYYDCFVFNAKKMGVYADFTGSAAPTVTDKQEKPSA